MTFPESNSKLSPYLIPVNMPKPLFHENACQGWLLGQSYGLSDRCRDFDRKQKRSSLPSVCRICRLLLLMCSVVRRINHNVCPWILKSEQVLMGTLGSRIQPEPRDLILSYPPSFLFGLASIHSSVVSHCTHSFVEPTSHRVGLADPLNSVIITTVLGSEL